MSAGISGSNTVFSAATISVPSRSVSSGGSAERVSILLVLASIVSVMKAQFPFAQPCAEPQVSIEVTLRSSKFNGKPRTCLIASGRIWRPRQVPQQPRLRQDLSASHRSHHTTLGRQGIITLIGGPTQAKPTGQALGKRTTHWGRPWSGGSLFPF